MRRISWNLLPVSPLQSFFSADLEQVFDQLVQGLKSPDPNPGQPLRLNVWESGQTVIVEGDLPGVDPENLSIEVGPKSMRNQRPNPCPRGRPGYAGSASPGTGTGRYSFPSGLTLPRWRRPSKTGAWS